MRPIHPSPIFVAAAVLAGVVAACTGNDREADDDSEATAAALHGGSGTTDDVARSAVAAFTQGRTTFRYDTFGDEDFWGGTLRLHEPFAGVSPRAALGLGLKVDSEALPRRVVRALKRGQVDLDDPAVTKTLLKLDAVIGVKGFFDPSTDALTSIGIQCSFCHSTVDDALAPGIGRRLDGWPNRDLDVGKIVDLSPDLSAVAALLGVPEPTVRTVLRSWGPGKYDASLFLDGKATRPDGAPAATLLPPAFGLAGVNMQTFTGWGSVTHWNALVANVEMHGKGTFIDPRLDDATRFPVAARAGFGHIRSSPDLVTSKLAALQLYQLAIPAPTPKPGSFDAVAAARGQVVFDGKGKCATCHVPPLFTEPGWNLHTPAEIGIDDFQASRSPERAYRTAPLRGLFAHGKGGYYHDGRFADLRAVVDHYDTVKTLALSGNEKDDLVAYLKSL